MRRFFVCAGLIAGLFLSGAEARGAHDVRIALAPGFSFAAPLGFMACDATTNRLLGNAAHLKVMDHLCARAQRPGLRLFLINSDPRRPVMIMAFYTTEYTFPDALIADASPELKALMSHFVCEEWLTASNNVQHCDLQTGSLAGRPAIIGDVAAADAGGGQMVRFYLASNKTGTMALEVMGPASAKPYISAYIAAVAGSVQAEPQEELPPPDLVKLTPAPGITMSVPKGWIACDDAADTALLGNTPDPDNIGPRACVGASAHQTLMLFDPHRFHYSNLKVSYFTNKVDADRFADLITPDALARGQPKECAEITKPLVDNGGTVLSCTETAGTLAGHPAKIVTILTSEESQPGLPTVQYQNILTDVPYSQGIVEFQTVTAVMLKSITQPPLDAMMNSVVMP